MFQPKKITFFFIFLLMMGVLGIWLYLNVFLANTVSSQQECLPDVIAFA